MRALGVLGLLSLVACAPPPADPTAADAAVYFGLADGARFTFEGPGGVTEIHEYARDTTVEAGREVFRRTVTRGGFVQDADTFFLEASLDGLQIVRFFDCITRCGEPASPFPIMAFPLVERQRNAGEAEVEITLNGAAEETRTEAHAFQADTFGEITVPAGTFNAVELVWTRDVADARTTQNLSFVPEVGFVRLTNDAGEVFEATETP